jgi:hypothetical protein
MSKRPSNSCRKKRANDSVPCSVTIPIELQQQIIARANQEDRTFSAVIRRAVAQYVGSK